MKTIKVMIVDNEELSADGVTDIINQENINNIETLTFYSSLKAVEYLGQNQIDILITDINMPKLSGLELIKRVYDLQPNMKIIILTGYGSLEYATEAMTYGVKHFLQKPIQPTQLVDSLRELIKEQYHLKQLNLMELKTIVERSFLGGGSPVVVENKICFFIYYSKFHKRVGQVITQELENARIDFVIGSLEMYTIVYFVNDSTIDYLLQEAIHSVSRKELVICIAEDQEIKNIKCEIDKAIHYLNWVFYYPQENLIFLNTKPNLSRSGILEVERLFKLVKMSLKQKDYIESKALIKKIFDKSKSELFSPKLLKSELISSFFPVFISQGKNLSDISKFEDEINGLTNFSQLDKQIESVMRELEGSEQLILKGNSISENLNLIVEKYYSDTSLSLKWIAKNLLFLNAEHLGRAYQKETGEKFLTHLVNFRIEKAKWLLRNGKKVYEVAELVGYGDNPDYFVKIFKKKMGITPLKYGKSKFK